jgi:hypothetical protein
MTKALLFQLRAHYIAKRLQDGVTIGVDGSFVSIAERRQMASELWAAGLVVPGTPNIEVRNAIIDVMKFLRSRMT